MVDFYRPGYSSYGEEMVLHKLVLALQDLVGYHPLLLCIQNCQIIALHEEGLIVWASHSDYGIMAKQDCLLANWNTRECILAA